MSQVEDDNNNKKRGVSGRTNYPKSESDTMVNQILDYISKQDDIIDYIKNRVLLRNPETPKEEVLKRIEHPELTLYLKASEKHWTEIQKIYALHDLEVDRTHAIDKNETIEAKKKLLEQLFRKDL